MPRLSLVALLTLAFSGVAFATPVVSDLHARDSTPFVPCQGTAAVVTNVDVSPIPLAPGAQTIITITANAVQEIVEGSYAMVTAMQGTEPLSNDSVDICETAQCPILQGTSYSFDFVFDMPEDVPADRVNVITQGFPPNSEGISLFCVGFKPGFKPARQ